MRTFIVGILLAASFTSCQSENAYLANRAGDLSEIVRAHVMWGPGGGAKLEVTQFLHLGYMDYEADAWGIHNRGAGQWKETVKSKGLLVGDHSEKVSGIPVYTGSYGWDTEGGDFSFSHPDNRFIDSLMVRASVMAYGGIDVQLRLDEAIDFVAGLFTLDPSGDDRK